MCVNAAGRIAEKALDAARAEWDLVATIRAEAKVHSGVVIEARKLLQDRRDDLALNIFDQVVGTTTLVGQGADLEKARALVEER